MSAKRARFRKSITIQNCCKYGEERAFSGPAAKRLLRMLKRKHRLQISVLQAGPRRSRAISGRIRRLLDFGDQWEYAKYQARLWLAYEPKMHAWEAAAMRTALNGLLFEMIRRQTIHEESRHSHDPRFSGDGSP